MASRSAHAAEPLSKGGISAGVTMSVRSVSASITAKNAKNLPGKRVYENQKPQQPTVVGPLNEMVSNALAQGRALLWAS